MIQDFINALASTNEKYWFYLDTNTMTIVKNRSTVDDMDVAYLAHAYPDRFLPLPDKKQIHTYAIMEDYVASSPHLKVKDREKLRAALEGAGPFRRFREEVKRQGLEEDWLQYRDSRFEQMAREWCISHHISIDYSCGEEQSPTLPENVETASSTIALIEAIRLLFNTLDDEGFERALDDLVAAIKNNHHE